MIPKRPLGGFRLPPVVALSQAMGARHDPRLRIGEVVLILVLPYPLIRCAAFSRALASSARLASRIFFRRVSRCPSSSAVRRPRLSLPWRIWFAIYALRWLSPKVSTFTGLSCHKKGYGLGKTVDTWYATGIPPTTPK